MLVLESKLLTLIGQSLAVHEDQIGTIAGRREGLEALAQILMKIGNELIVEIGTYRGWTATFLGQALQILGKPNFILSIDPLLLAQGNAMDFLNTVAAARMEKRCFIIVTPSEYVASFVCGAISLLIIDGNHNYDFVRKDLELYAPKVVREGFIFIDDYSPNHPGVVKAADGYLEQHSEFAVTDKLMGARTGSLIVQRVT